MDDKVDVGQFEELLNFTDDLTITSNSFEEKNNSSNETNGFLQCINENHEILR